MTTAPTPHHLSPTTDPVPPAHERRDDNELLVVVVGGKGDVDDTATRTAAFADLEHVVAIAFAGEPAQADTIESLWSSVARADVVVGLAGDPHFDGDDDDADRYVSPTTSAVLSAAAMWMKPALLVFETLPDDLTDQDRHSALHPDVWVMSADHARGYVEQLAKTDWSAPSAEGWRQLLELVELRLPGVPADERVEGGPFCGLRRLAVLAELAAAMRGHMAEADRLAIGNPPIAIDSESTAVLRAAVLAQADAEWNRWPPEYARWSKFVIEGIKRSAHPYGFLDRAILDVRAHDWACVAELLRRRATYHGGGVTDVGRELQILATLIEIGQPLEDDGSINERGLADAVEAVMRMRPDKLSKFGGDRS